MSNWKDGRWKHPLYQVWQMMKQRCDNPRDTHYKDYGGRGIRVCKRWYSFQDFVKDVGERPSPKHTLGRKNNNGNYTPENFRWETSTEQNRNRRDTRMLTANGKTKPLPVWAEEMATPRATLSNRRRRGWTDEQIINTPIRSWSRR